MAEPVLLIHGGAGPASPHESEPTVRQQYGAALRHVLQEAGALLSAGESAITVVARAVSLLEDCALFNAGHGAVFTRDNTHELDASIMDGSRLACGAVASVSTIRNPVLAARAVMEHSQHVMLVGAGAESFAREQGLQLVHPDYFSTDSQRHQCGDNTTGTVGAVALDQYGNLAAATSTGGMAGKHPGRVGDSPIIGAGCYANNATCAVSATGTGEAFIRVVAAHDVSAQMQYGGRSLRDATDDVVFRKLPSVDGEGGLIAVDRRGQISLVFNTENMYRGYIRPGQEPLVAVGGESDGPKASGGSF